MCDFVSPTASQRKAQDELSWNSGRDAGCVGGWRWEMPFCLLHNMCLPLNLSSFPVLDSLWPPCYWEGLQILAWFASPWLTLNPWICRFCKANMPHFHLSCLLTKIHQSIFWQLFPAWGPQAALSLPCLPVFSWFWNPFLLVSDLKIYSPLLYHMDWALDKTVALLTF